MKTRSIYMTLTMLLAALFSLSCYGAGSIQQELGTLDADGKTVWYKGRLLGVEPFINRLRKAHPKPPIILVEDSSFRGLPSQKGDILRKIFTKLIKQGDKNLYLISNKGMLGQDFGGTVDGIHPNDLGMARQAAVFTQFLKPILEVKMKVKAP